MCCEYICNCILDIKLVLRKNEHGLGTFFETSSRKPGIQTLSQMELIVEEVVEPLQKVALDLRSKTFVVHRDVNLVSLQILRRHDRRNDNTLRHLDLRRNYREVPELFDLGVSVVSDGLKVRTDRSFCRYSLLRLNT